MKNKELELRMYLIVPYNIMPIQQGIQSGHAALRYVLKYGRYNPDHIIWEFIEKHETWVILNGGTTNDQRELGSGQVLGTLNQIGDELRDNDVEFSFFIEPDLNNALSALCVVCDERVFNYEDYPSFIDYIIDLCRDDNDAAEFSIQCKLDGFESLKAEYPIKYKKWVSNMGGEKNVFLRELLGTKKLA